VTTALVNAAKESLDADFAVSGALRAMRNGKMTQAEYLRICKARDEKAARLRDLRALELG
jgi:hypothetical protein